MCVRPIATGSHSRRLIRRPENASDVRRDPEAEVILWRWWCCFYRIRLPTFLRDVVAWRQTRHHAPAFAVNDQLDDVECAEAGIGYSAAQLQRFGDIGPTPAMGQGFGLGFAVRTETGQNPLPGSTGSFYWTGAYGTTFFIDPKQQLVIIMMI